MPVDPPKPDKYSFTMQGVTVEVPTGWEARIRRSAFEVQGAAMYPVMHAATVPLSADRADYGGGVVENLSSEDLFVSLVEFGDEAIGSKLYPQVEHIPVLQPSMFSPFQLQRRIAGQGGVQVFFTLHNRAFCLYVVIGSYARRVELTARANEILHGLSIEPRLASPSSRGTLGRRLE